jgi:hypothetical protein
MFREIIELERQSRGLERLRDYLLPQLLSGEIVIQNKENSQSGEDEVESN